MTRINLKRKQKCWQMNYLEIRKPVWNKMTLYRLKYRFIGFQCVTIPPKSNTNRNELNELFPIQIMVWWLQQKYEAALFFNWKQSIPSFQQEAKNLCQNNNYDAF